MTGAMVRVTVAAIASYATGGGLVDELEDFGSSFFGVTASRRLW